MARELSLRGIGVAVVAMYVEDVGGQRLAATGRQEIYIGPGWQIELAEGGKVRVGAVQLGVTHVRIEGPEAVVAEIEAALSKKVLRAGG